MKRVLNRMAPAALLVCGLNAVPAFAVVVPEGSRLADKSFRQDALNVPEINQPLSALPTLAAGLQQELRELGVQPDQGFYDTRTGRWTSLILTQPVVPGSGYGNHLRWSEAVARPQDDEALGRQTWNAVQAFLLGHEAQLRVDLAQLATPRIGVFEHGDLIQIHSQRVVGGIPVRDSGLTAIVNHGNLILLGLQNWADATVPAVSISGSAAATRVSQHLSPHFAGLSTPRLEIIPTLHGGDYDYRPAWVVAASVADDNGTWEGLVDAATGDLLAFEDRSQYARRVQGGVYPVSNDGRPGDGQEQAGWPMPFMTTTVGGTPVTSTTGGNVGCGQGALTSAPAGQLAGPFIRISDGCGAFNETIATGDLDLGAGTGTDCIVPAGHSVGDTHSARSGFYELNRIKEQAKGWLPSNAWLSAQLTANMNIVNSCNAFWNGSTVNFYRDSVNCRNTGEIAAIFDHEWGHGMDNNGINPNISQPGEAIADIHAMLRLKNSCVGRGFFKNQVCGGYGDACTGTTSTGCTGVRDLDFANHRCNLPHTVTWATSGFTTAQCAGGAPACPAGGGTPCGRETHCEGLISAETGWDLYARDLQSAPFNLDSNTALELAGRMAFLGSQTLTSWYSCSVGGGCGATNGYLLFLAADDDNGNLNDGTPHMQAVRGAFERHQIHCATPAVANSGCAGGPTTAPTVTATATSEGVNLTWTPVTGASRYYVFRAEGISACNFGKVKAGDVTTPSFQDTGLQGGRTYSYVVMPVGSNTSCFAPASACATATAIASAQCIVQSVAPTALAVDAGGNGVLQPNEPGVVVAPSWRNTGNTAISLTGALSNFTGPAGPTYTISDAAANYGSIPVNTVQACTDCYAVSISGTRPAQHWDSTALETMTPTGTTKSWTLHVGDSFTDVAGTNGFYRFIETIFHKGVTGGCGTGTYCPGNATSREQMAAFVLVAKEGAGYNPPLCVAPNYFSDVPETSPFCKFIEELANRQVVSGCGPNLYCPSSPVTREQMAVFVLRTLDPALNPPACGTPVFNDVPASSPFCKWVEELARRGIVTGCGNNNYCPSDPVTREQMAVFLAQTFSLQLYGL